MRWRQARRSQNVEDRRGMRPGRALTIGGGGGLVVLLLAVLLGFDPSSLGGLTGGPATAWSSERGEAPPESDEMAQFVRAVLGDTEDTWNALFEAEGHEAYREPRLVLFSGGVNSACGFQGTATGPFYCPADGQVYIDLDFYRTLRERLGAPGDFAQAYVIAHEVGHHVQNLLGISERVQRQRDRVSEAEFNDLSVRLELQADFFAGVWAHHAQRRGLLEPGDIEEALNAAAAIGDDRLQRESQGYVVPESFTHGTSEQRARWFRKGLETGDMTAGNTFTARRL